jgi:solute carrier family 45, member 1/2/4
VDCVPTEQQNVANAWAGRMIGVGNVLGYLRSPTSPRIVANFSGYINLPYSLPALGKTQFQILCILGPVSLVVTVLVTCLAIREVDPALLFQFPGQEENEKGVQVAISVIPPPHETDLS